MGDSHLADDSSIGQQLKDPDQLDPQDVTTPAPLHVLIGDGKKTGRLE